MKLEFHSKTVTDYFEASDHYEKISPALQRQFRAEVLATIDRILANPLSYVEVKGIRRALMSGFPYSVLYRVSRNETIRVLVIRHHRRDTQFGDDRA